MNDKGKPLIFQPEKCETVVVIGAGASKHAGLPLLNNFGSKLSELISSPQLTCEERRLLIDAISLFAVYRCPKDNIEALFSVVSAGALLGNLRCKEDRDLLAKGIALTSELSRDPRPSKDAYCELAKAIGRCNPWGTKIISFNYDVAMDIGFARANVELVSWLAERTRASYRVQTNIQLLCLRPHGCISWGVCPDCHRARVMGPKQISEHIKPEFYRDIINTSCSWHTGEESPKHEPCLIAPTWDKRTNVSDLQGIWTATAQALMQCRRLLVIGFSLPPTDANVDSMFRFALARNTRLHKVMVVDPGQTSQYNWCRILVDTQPELPYLRPVRCPFEESICEISSWLNDKKKP